MPTSPDQLPERVTTPLLTLVTNESLDEDYQHVADRKVARGEAPTSRDAITGHRGAAVVVALFGLLLVVAAVQTSRNAAATEEGRQSLIRQIEGVSQELRDHRQAARDLERGNEALARELRDVSRRERDVSATVTRLASTSGFAPVTGPGLRMRTNDAPDGSSDGVIRDEDLSLLIDGLWSAGAEAIAINGHRLTPISGIRSVSSAIHVKAQPLRPPYTVVAIGNPDTLEAMLAESQHGLQWLNLVRLLGFEWSTDSADSLSLPGGLGGHLRSAVPLDKTEQPKEVLP